jgi:hypothetical protein
MRGTSGISLGILADADRASAVLAASHRSTALRAGRLIAHNRSMVTPESIFL